jgi:type II secretory pathway component PulF
MSRFRYKAKSGPAQVMEGLLEAESRVAALDQLSQKGYFPVRLEEQADPSKNRRWPFSSGVSRKDRSLFTRQLADLLESEVPLLKALELTREHTNNAALIRLTGDIVDQVRGGERLSEALRNAPLIFPPLYVSLIHAGEVGGTLSVTLGHLADFIEQEDDFRSRVQAALAYPLLITFVGIGTVVFLVTFAVPRLAAMFTDMGQSLPPLTRFLISLSAGMTSIGRWWIAILLAGGFLGLAAGLRKKTKTASSRLLFQIPIWGPVAQKSVIARFARTLSTLLAGGVPVVEALRVVANVVDPPSLKDGVLEAAQKVEQGASLSESLKEAPGFPTFIRQMIAVGEEVNALEKSLNKAATAYERETDRALKVATSLLEPCMILFIGTLVGAIIVAMLLPIFQISAFVK